MTNWTGYWMIVISILHIGVAVIFFGDAYKEFIANGVWGTVTSSADSHSFWFMIGGFMMFAIGICLLNMPSKPFYLGLILLGIAVIGAALVPQSGFWLLFPPALAITFSMKSA